MPIAPAFDPTTGASGGAPPAVASGQGEPLLVLDWAPTGTGGPYAGSYAGVDHTIAGQVIKVQDKDSGASSVGTVSLEAGGLRIQQTGGSGDPLAIRLDLSSLTGMAGTYNGLAVNASFSVTTLSQSNASLNMMIHQNMPNQANNANTAFDMQCQAFRNTASNYQIKASRWNSASTKTTYSYTASSLTGGGQPANIRLSMFGTAYQWWIGADTTAGAGVFQSVGLGANQRKLVQAQGSGAVIDAGLAYPIIGFLVGRGETTPNDLHLTHLRVYTYGNP